MIRLCEAAHPNGVGHDGAGTCRRDDCREPLLPSETDALRERALELVLIEQKLAAENRVMAGRMTVPSSARFFEQLAERADARARVFRALVQEIDAQPGQRAAG